MNFPAGDVQVAIAVRYFMFNLESPQNSEHEKPW